MVDISWAEDTELTKIKDTSLETAIKFARILKKLPDKEAFNIKENIRFDGITLKEFLNINKEENNNEND